MYMFVFFKKTLNALNKPIKNVGFFFKKTLKFTKKFVFLWKKCEKTLKTACILKKNVKKH